MLQHPDKTKYLPVAPEAMNKFLGRKRKKYLLKYK